MADDKNPKKGLLKTPPFRVSFPEVFKKRQFDANQAARYSVVALFQPFEIVNGATTKRPTPAWSDKDKALWLAIIQKCDVVSREAFKKSLKELEADRNYKYPYHRGEEKTYSGYGSGIIFFTMASTKRRPGVVDLQGNAITEDSDNEFYAGCWARATCNPYAFNNVGKGVAIGLGNLQKLKEGERLDAFSSAEEDFGADSGEYAGDEDDLLGGEGGGGDTESEFD
jgi:hypothetical protein